MGLGPAPAAHVGLDKTTTNTRKNKCPMELDNMHILEEKMKTSRPVLFGDINAVGSIPAEIQAGPEKLSVVGTVRKNLSIY